MNSYKIIKDALAEYDENELIIASELYKNKLSTKVRVEAYYKALQRMNESGDIAKIAKGIYHLPKNSKYGIVPPSDKDIISFFIEKEKGLIVGYTLYNNLNLTTQVSKTIDIFSSLIEGSSKTIRNIKILYLPIDFTPETNSIIEGLEVLQNFNSIQDINYIEFIEYTKKLATSFKKEAFEKVIRAKSYKKSTISFLKEILDFYKVPHSLEKHLSPLSKYKHPKMEEIYEIARASR